MHPLGVVAILLFGAGILLAPRQLAVLPMLMMATFVSMQQRIVIATIDFDVLRILAIFSVLRIFLTGEFRYFRWTRFDKVFVAWAVAGAIMYVLLWRSSSAAINRAGFLWTAFGLYFTFRVLIRSLDDLRALLRGIAVIVIPVAAAFLFEQATQRNLFAVFGGVRAITWIRDGRLRCQGAFSHPIMAGCFWASFVPWFLAGWRLNGGERILNFVGAACATIIVYTCASSTPVFGYIAIIIGFSFYPFRQYMRLVRWGTVGMLAVLHVIREQPVWHLIGRISSLSGGTGWHRYRLIDGFLRHIPDWFLVGTRSTGKWGWGLQDVTNQYVLEGVRGGILRFVLFIALIVMGFRGVGRWVKGLAESSYEHLLAWSLGVSLFAHCLMFIGVSYFGQSWVAFYLLLAVLGSLFQAENDGAFGKPQADEESEPASAVPEAAASNPWRSASGGPPGELRQGADTVWKDASQSPEMREHATPWRTSDPDKSP